MNKSPGTATESLCELSACTARAMIGRRQISPVELTQACIERIELINPSVNAMVATDYEVALASAREAEQAVMRGDELGPLHGLPLGVKDLNVTAGLRTTFGSRLHADWIPERDERLIAALRHAGAIVIGKTNTPEFGAGANTVNDVYGATVNPFDTTRTCGGSSGGSAVALATDMAPICTGSDTGGSLRTPASFCGVVSIRGTPGTVPSDRRGIGLTTYNVQGPMARSVADASLMLSGFAGGDVCDPLHRPHDPAIYQHIEPVDLSTLRVAYSEDLGFAPIDNDIRAVFRDRIAAIAGWLRSCEPHDPQMSTASEVFWLIRGMHFLAGRYEHYEQEKASLGPNNRSNIEAALQMRPESIAWAMAEQTRIYRAFQSFFDSHDVLICPTAAVSPFPVDQLYCDTINGERLPNYIKWVDICAGLTLTGHPIVQLPCGVDHLGMPFGLQIVGPALHSDRFVIGVAAALEAMFAQDPRLCRPRPDIEALARR
ncbi:MAG: amidase [Gammaproteobacteria bacterium]|nr:amidase [Gammaproteobacteria bacterium]